MKKLFRKILVLAVVFGTFTSYANEVSEVNTSFGYVKKGNYISVTDASGEVIYSEKIANNGNLKTHFDFRELENGTYTVEVSKGFKIEISTIEVKNHLVTFIESNNKTIYKPLVRNENAYVLISKLALNSDNMRVELYFEGDLIHTETIKGEKVINRVYKLDKTLTGNYTTIIKSDDRVFVDNFRI